MKYSGLLSRIGAVIDRLVEMGFEDTTTESSLGRVFYIRKDQFSYRVVFYPTQIEFVGGYKAKSTYIEYTDNFEQELFDKLKECGIG
jgi:hypothetical protein